MGDLLHDQALQVLARQVETLQSQDDLNPNTVFKAKLEVCRLYSLDRVPSNSEILEFIDQNKRRIFEETLKRKSVRTRSGIAVVTAITKPFNCPHGTCIFCPGGVPFGTPQSYTKDSPAASFGIERQFEPCVQVRDSLALLSRYGHDTSKIELILLGGTILAMPANYQADFVKACYDSLNEFESESLKAAIRMNETARHRCVGLTIETKPDWCREEHIDRMLSFGATRVEIGVQSLRDDILRASNRGHTITDTFRAFSVSRDSAFKIVAHMMPGLPGSDPDKDLEDLVGLFSDERLRPDMLKIYPTLVVEGTALYKMYLLRKYRPYDLEELVEMLCKFKKKVPPWVRIMRIQREIPKHEIAGGAKAGNLRQLVLEEMARRGESCRCIRCREVGRKQLNVEFMHPELVRTDYEASSGQEVFLSFERKSSDTLFGFLRLRMHSGNEHRPELRGSRSSLVRELHVYGHVVPVGERTENSNRIQHRGLGTRLLEEAERISRIEFGMKKLVVISASGTKEYYRKRGYVDDGAYVSKLL